MAAHKLSPVLCFAEHKHIEGEKQRQTQKKTERAKTV